MKAPRYRYLNTAKPDEQPANPRDRFFWRWESMFYQRNGKRAGELLERIWEMRAKGSYLDTLDAEPVEDRALVLWMVAQSGRFCPYSKFPIEEYFSKKAT